MKNITTTLFAVMTAFTLSSCGANPTDKKDQSTQTSVSERKASDELTQQQAIARKARVSDISYTLDLDLVTSPDTYKGRVDTTFTLGSTEAPLTIDFAGGEVSSVILNGAQVNADYNGYFITLPAKALVQGKNNLSISYSHPYGQDGTGLHHFVDPEDGNTYLYSYLWPYYSNRLFPNFDQPNLKATYETTVRAKGNWQVVSSTREDSITNAGDDKVWHFPRSDKFSSYVFSLHAGPYKVWEDKAGDIPIRLMARQSLAPYVAAQEWLDYTKMGLEHYKAYFDIPYPFKKYDQLIVPDFNIGAMEDVAAVTFAESYVQHGPSSRFQKQRRASTILHEMAHMWFGDLVTKDWWDGLWLNESFATLMSSIAVSNLPEFKDLWHDFYLTENLTAIAADNLVSTHPIQVPVPSTSDFFSVFDAITYDKGASVLNQLSHYTGKENFRLGVSQYLKKHSWGNTELKDFISALSKQSGKDLAPWAEKWLYQAGVNSLKADFTCADGKISAFSIHQTAPANYPVMRSQYIQLALFSPKESKESMEPYAVLPIEVSGPKTTIAEATGLACPVIAYPNYQGWGYAEIELDATSIKNLTENLDKVHDPLLRSMFWTALLEAPSKGQITNEHLLEMIAYTIDNENNDRIINQILRALVSKMNGFERAGNPVLASHGPLLEKRLWSSVTDGENSKSTRLIKLASFIQLARSPEALSNLHALLDGSVMLKDIPTSQGLRWQLINRLAKRGDPTAPSILDAEKLTDLSDAGKRAAIAAEASLPNPAIKKKWFAVFLNEENPLPLSNQRAAMENLFPSNQGALQEALLPEMIAALPSMAKTRDHYYQRSYARDLFAGVCSPKGLEQIYNVLDKDEIGTTLYRFLSENVQHAKACVAARAKG